MILMKLFEYNTKQINAIKALNKARYLLNDNEFNVYADYAVNKLSLEQLAKKYNLLNIKSFLNNIYDKLNNYSQNEVQRKSRQKQNNNIQDDNLEADTINNITNDENKKILLQFISKLPEKYERILRLRYGIGLDKSYTLQEISDELGISRERVRQIEIKSIEILRRLITRFNKGKKLETNKKKEKRNKEEQIKPISEEKIKKLIEDILDNSKIYEDYVYYFKMYYGLNDSGKKYSLDEIYVRSYYYRTDYFRDYETHAKYYLYLIKRDIHEVAAAVENKLKYDDKYKNIDKSLKMSAINFLISDIYKGANVFIKSRKNKTKEPEYSGSDFYEE